MERKYSVIFHRLVSILDEHNFFLYLLSIHLKPCVVCVCVDDFSLLCIHTYSTIIVLCAYEKLKHSHIHRLCYFCAFFLSLSKTKEEEHFLRIDLCLSMKLVHIKGACSEHISAISPFCVDVISALE